MYVHEDEVSGRCFTSTFICYFYRKGRNYIPILSYVDTLRRTAVQCSVVGVTVSYTLGLVPDKPEWGHDMSELDHKSMHFLLCCCDKENIQIGIHHTSFISPCVLAAQASKLLTSTSLLAIKELVNVTSSYERVLRIRLDLHIQVSTVA